MKTKIFMLVLALQCAWILGTTCQQERVLRAGKIILLETERVDPRDPLRGDYLILNYKISTVRTNLFSPPLPKDLRDGTAVYVALAPRGEFYEAVRASLQPIAAGGDEIMLRGRSGWTGSFASWRGNLPGGIHVEYGLEHFFVHEGTGNPSGKLTVQVAVPVSGRASLKQVFVAGKPYAEAMKPKGD